MAERLEIVTDIAWCLRWTVDHALILADVQSTAARLPEPVVWRSVNYNTQDPEELLEWSLAAAHMTRHQTIDDPVSSFDAALRRAAHAALGKQRKCSAHAPRAAEGADSYIGNLVAEWLTARAYGLAAEHVTVDATTALIPTDDAVADARRGFDVLRRLRSAARQSKGAARRQRAEKYKEWQTECVATARGTTKRLLGAPGLSVISIVEHGDGTSATGTALPQAVWEQSRGMRTDAQLRDETMRFLRDYPGDRLGPELDTQAATRLLWGLNSSAPGVDQISARMLRHLEAWAPETWCLWVAQQNHWRRDLARGYYDPVLLWVLEMRLPKGKKQLLVEACRPVGMEPIRIRMEQLLCARHFRSGMAEGDIRLPPTQCAYQPGVSAGTAQRINSNIDLDAIHRHLPVARYSEDKSDAFGRIRHAKIAEDLLSRGVPSDVVYRLVIFWSMALIFVITAAGLTAPYTQDHAAVQGDMVAQLVYLLYVLPAYEAVAAQNVGYRYRLTGYPELHIPMLSYSDDNLVITHLARHLARCVRAAGAALAPRLLTNSPLKGAALAYVWRVVRGEHRPASQRFELFDQGVLVPIYTLRSHIPYLGFELCILVGAGWSVKRIRAAIQRVWYGALRGHMRADTCRTVHQQCVIGTVNHLAQVNPPPRSQLAELDTLAGACYKRKCAWATHHPGAAVRAPNGGGVASIADCAIAHHTASLLNDLNSRLFPARATTREQLLHSFANPLEAGSEYAFLRRNLARLGLTLVAAAPLPGRAADPSRRHGCDDDPQLRRLEELGMRRAPA
eukprot:gene2216-2094_t